MAQPYPKPVILLAFANEQGQPGRYLRNLPEELRQVQRVLRPGEREGRYQVVALSNASLESLVETFQDPEYQGRLLLFHYGGHAEGDRLLLEGSGRQTATIEAQGLLPFLEGLRLVFLNGCATQAQVEGLLAARVGVVIATAQAIPDKVATEFATHFYRGLAGGASLREAYRQAEGVVQAREGRNTLRGLHWGGATKSWPWLLAEGQAGAAGWRLPSFTPPSTDPQALLAQMPTEAIPNYATLPPGSRMPFSRNPNFVGRKQDLLSLARSLKGGETTVIGQVAAATGLGGIGKTQLAVEFVHRYGQYFAGGVFWLSFVDPASAKIEIATCGQRGYLNLAPDFAGLDLDTQLGLVLSAWQSPLPRLLIFDNCEEEELLRDWRPPTGGSRVLITSRRATWSPALGVQPLPLDVLDRAESLALLGKYRPDLPADDPTLKTIAAELGDLPLALDLAAGNFLHTYRQTVTPAAYLAQLRDKRLLDHPSLQGRGATLSATDHECHVARTFALSYDRLQGDNETDALAMALLGRAAYFAPGEPIPHVLLLATIEVDEEDPDAALTREDALQRLVGLGLLSSVKGEALLLHRLLAYFVQPAIADPAEAQAAVEEAILNAVGQQQDEGGHLQEMQPLFGHLRVVTDTALNRADEPAADLALWTGNYLRQIGDYPAARPLYERALALREKALGPEHPETATSLNNLAVLLKAQGEYEAARPLYERALALREKALGPEHPWTATSLGNLAGLLQDQGESEAARPLYERALALREKALGPEHPWTATSLGNLALLLQDQGEYEAARPLYERALALREKALGPEHPETATSLNNLAGLLKAQGEYEAARPLYERALALREKALGPEHPWTATSLNNLAGLLQDQGEYEAARPLYERALAIKEKALGPEHPETATSLNNLAVLLKAQGEYEAARPLYERALALSEKALGPEHPWTATSLGNLAGLLQDQGEYEAARPLYERALALSEKALGPEHPWTATSLGNLALLLQDQGEYEAARPLYERALALFEKVLGPEHPTTKIVRDNLASLDA